MLTKEPQQTWVFDRYVNGVLMAEGVEVTRASSLEEAMVIAARLAARGPNGETPVLILCNALDALARAEKAEQERDTFRINLRSTFEAMCAMRDAINEYVPMPSLESDLLQGPENSIFCATVAEAVITRLAAEKTRADAAEALVKGLRDFVVDFADAKIDALRYSPPHGASPEDEPDPVVDAETVWAWQADAKDAIKAAALALTPGKRYLDGHGEVKGPLHSIFWENGEEMLTDSYVVWHPDGTLAGGTREDKRSLVAEVE